MTRAGSFVAQSEGNDLPHCSNAETASVNAASQRLRMHHTSRTFQEPVLLLLCSSVLLRWSRRLAKDSQLQAVCACPKQLKTKPGAATRARLATWARSMRGQGSRVAAAWLDRLLATTTVCYTNVKACNTTSFSRTLCEAL